VILFTDFYLALLIPFSPAGEKGIFKAREPLIKSKNYERRAPKLNFGRSASADNFGGCATPKVEFWHPARLNQSFLEKTAANTHNPMRFHAERGNEKTHSSILP